MPPRALPLIDHVGLLLERTYDFRSGLLPLGRFVVGAEGRERVLEDGPATRSVEQLDSAAEEACLYLRPLEAPGQWAAALYLPGELVEELESADPRRRLDRRNLPPFLTLVEEVDHLLTFADRVRAPGSIVSLLELEWHAAVSKFLVATHFAGRLSGRRRLGSVLQRLLREEVFGGDYSAESDAGLASRYTRANRLASRFVERLDGVGPARRLGLLRRFHWSNHFEKLRRFA